jgi:hypothetical protein
MPENSLHRCDPRQLRCVPPNRAAGMNTVAAAVSNPAATASRGGVAVAVAASCLGWSLDLFILLYVAPVVGRLFFRSDSPMLSLAAVYAAFAVTMVKLPAGAGCSDATPIYAAARRRCWRRCKEASAVSISPSR